jgi:signal recognition particle GTPase
MIIERLRRSKKGKNKISESFCEATATVERTARENLIAAIDTLSSAAIPQLKGYIDRLCEEERIAAEIAALEAKYGTTPNAETIAAIEECRAGKGKTFHSIEELMADLHDENDD